MKPRRIGYSRTIGGRDSVSGRQHIDELTALGCTGGNIFVDDTSREDRAFPELQLALNEVRAGDYLVVLMLRKGVKSAELVDIDAQLKPRGAFLDAAGLGIDTSTPEGNDRLHLIVQILAEAKATVSDRIRKGVADAKNVKGTHGRMPTAMQRSTEVLALHKAGTKASAIAAKVGISRASVYRILDGVNPEPKSE